MFEKRVLSIGTRLFFFKQKNNLVLSQNKIKQNILPAVRKNIKRYFQNY